MGRGEIPERDEGGKKRPSVENRQLMNNSQTFVEKGRKEKKKRRRRRRSPTLESKKDNWWE